jgi:hypothetical protein
MDLSSHKYTNSCIKITARKTPVFRAGVLAISTAIVIFFVYISYLNCMPARIINALTPMKILSMKRVLAKSET